MAFVQIKLSLKSAATPVMPPPVKLCAFYFSEILFIFSGHCHIIAIGFKDLVAVLLFGH